jgi:hypothetical protein
MADPDAMGELAAVDNLPPDLLVPLRARTTVGGPDYPPDAFEAAAERVRARYPGVDRVVLPESATEGPLQAVTSLGRGLAAAPGNVGRVAETAMGRLADPGFYATQPPPDVTPGGMQAPPYVAPGQGSLAARIGGTIIGAPVKSVIDRVMLPGKAISGEFNPFEQDSEAADWAAETAMGMIARGVSGGAPAGALGATGGRLVQPTFEAPGIAGALATPVRRRPYAPIDSPVNAGYEAPANSRIQTVTDPQRMMYPRIYANPREIVAAARANWAPESPWLKRLFGVTRDDLYEMSRARGAGDLQPGYIIPPGAKNNSYAANNVMTPQNTQRLTDTLGLALQDPKLRTTINWYMMDPLYHKMVELHGAEAAPRAYWDYINYTGMASPAANVMTEIARGTGAHWLAKQNRFEDFVKYGGVPEGKRAGMPDFPPDMMYFPGHAYHSTSQALPMQKFRDRGNIYESESPKVTTYLPSHGTPETGYQMTYPVQDSHIARSTGFADVRTGGPKSVGKELSMSEYMTHLPWYREKISKPLGLYAGQTQPLQWNTFAHATGVDTPVGAPKLELMADQMAKASRRLGVSPETARDMILTGGAGAGALLMAPQMGSLAEPPAYQ